MRSKSFVFITLVAFATTSAAIIPDVTAATAPDASTDVTAATVPDASTDATAATVPDASTDATGSVYDATNAAPDYSILFPKDTAEPSEFIENVREVFTTINKDNMALKTLVGKLQEGADSGKIPSDAVAVVKQMAQQFLASPTMIHLKQKITAFVNEKKEDFTQKLADKKDKILAMVKQIDEKIKNYNVEDSKLCDITTDECMKKLAPLLGGLAVPVQNFVNANKEQISAIFKNIKQMKGSMTVKFKASADKILTKITEMVQTGNADLLKEVDIAALAADSAAASSPTKRQLRGGK